MYRVGPGQGHPKRLNSPFTPILAGREISHEGAGTHTPHNLYGTAGAAGAKRKREWSLPDSNRFRGLCAVGGP